MKKFLTLMAISALLMTVAGCSSQGEKKDDNPVCTKLELVVEWSNISNDILDNFDIVFSGKDFQGNSFSFPLTEKGKKNYVIDGVEIKDTKDHCPFTIGSDVMPKTPFASKDSYNATRKYIIKVIFYDAKGNKLVCLDTIDDGFADKIVSSEVEGYITAGQKYTAEENFQRDIVKSFRNTSTTFVFFRNSANKKFGHSTPSED